jgi:adenylate cyclase class 2
MEIEYEATFTNINKEEIRAKLKKVGAELVRPEFLQKRVTFSPPIDGVKGQWLRVRDEGDKITMSYKIVDGNEIHNQKEVCLVVDSFEQAELFLLSIGAKKKSYQETKRELWLLNSVEITIDEWPYLEPFVEVEGKSEQAVKDVSVKIGFLWNDAKFCAVGTLYSKKYGIPEDQINNQTPEITFKKPNPFKKTL